MPPSTLCVLGPRSLLIAIAVFGYSMIRTCVSTKPPSLGTAAGRGENASAWLVTGFAGSHAQPPPLGFSM